MKIKSLIVGLCISLCSTVFAANQHVHPEANNTDSNKSTDKNIAMPGYCEIEIINNSFNDVRVYGVFDDGLSLSPFNMYSFGPPEYISMYYYGYCHYGMDIYIDTWDGYHVYSGYTQTRSSIRLVPYLTNQIKADVHMK